MTYFYAPISIFDLLVQSPEALPKTHTKKKLERVDCPALATEFFGFENKLCEQAYLLTIKWPISTRTLTQKIKCDVIKISKNTPMICVSKGVRDFWLLVPGLVMKYA